ncbi:MAG: hypothetical protein M1839_006960 [Geoglossum umbratile]|nr:MAG: hypothetical protein M1839_006960 [Geoglossum umbratile]
MLSWSIEGTYNPSIVPKRRLVPVPFQTDDGGFASLQTPSWAWAGWGNKVQMPLVGDLGESTEVKFHGIICSGEVVEISESTDKSRPDEDTLRREWKNPARPPLHQSLSENILNHPLKLTVLRFWSSSAWARCDWFVGPTGELFPNLGLGPRKFHCAWKQIPHPKPPMPDTGGTVLRPGQKIYNGAAECVVIGKGVGVKAGGCGESLLLTVFGRDENYPTVYRCGVVNVPGEEWILLDHSWNLFVLG